MPDLTDQPDEHLAYSWHVHATGTRGPYFGGRWCRSFDKMKGEPPEYDPTTGYPLPLDQKARAYGMDHTRDGGYDFTIEGPLGYGQDRCSYQLTMARSERAIDEGLTTVAENTIRYFHLHTEDEPYCRSWFKGDAKASAEQRQAKFGGTVEGPLEYGKDACPYLNAALNPEVPEEDEDEEISDTPVGEDGPEEDEDEEISDTPVGEDGPDEPDADEPEEASGETEEAEEPAAVEPAEEPPVEQPAPAKRGRRSSKKAAAESVAEPEELAAPTVESTVKTHDGHPIDLHELECSSCNGTLDNHKCPAQRRRNQPSGRKAVTEHPVCPHCGGRAHWNDQGTKVNVECLIRQMLLETGALASPYDRLPVFEMDDIINFGKWLAKKKKEGVTLAYGKMAAENGAAGTFAAIRQAQQKAAKAQQTEAAAPGTRIEDIAETVQGEEVDDFEETVPEKPKRKTKKEKAAEKAEAEAAAPAEAVTPVDKKAARQAALKAKLAGKAK